MPPELKRVVEMNLQRKAMEGGIQVEREWSNKKQVPGGKEWMKQRGGKNERRQTDRKIENEKKGGKRNLKLTNRMISEETEQKKDFRMKGRGWTERKEKEEEDE